MYEESFRTPLVMRLPSKIKAGTVDELVQNIDYAPTFLELAGVEVPAEMQGFSLVPLMEGDTETAWRDALYYHYYEYPGPHSVKRHYGIRTDRYKLIHFYEDIDQWELYDLQSDPEELHNLYGKDGYKDITVSLQGQLAGLQETYRDTTALKHE
jgi:arylsulfatase A-like enzyme